MTLNALGMRSNARYKANIGRILIIIKDIAKRYACSAKTSIILQQSHLIRNPRGRQLIIAMQQVWMSMKVFHNN